jgi:glycosyltransferase involved in cell wall biosynthesis
MNQTPQIPDRPTDGRRLHVLMCAVACHPDVGSEYAVGWQWVQRVAAIHDLTVVTADSRGSRAAIEAYRAQNPAFAAAATFVFLSPFDTPPSLWVRKMRRMIPIFYYRAYRQWLREAADTARGIIASRHVDLVHQTTFITFREPGVLCRLGRPFVWGPVGGNQCVPVAFLPGLGLVDGLRNTARNVINWLQFNGKRDVGYAMRHAAAISTVSSDTQRAIQKRYGRGSTVIPATACAIDAPPVMPSSSSHSIRFIFTGALIGIKALPLALHSLATMRDLEWSLDVVGRGPQEARWRAIAIRLGLANRVHFHGGVLRSEAIAKMATATALVFPALKEGWPTVVMEALALGVPVVTTNHNGMADMVTGECGFLLPVDHPRHLIAELARVLRLLATDRPLRDRLAQGALQRAARFSADRQTAAIADLYTAALAASRG